MKRHLGLDISTTYTGWAVVEINDDDKYVDLRMGHIDLTQASGLIDKSHIALKHLTAIAERFEVEEIFIEENMQAFRPGASKADTILKLAKINGVITFLCHQTFGVVPRSVNVNKARKTLGMRLQREKACGVSTKDQVHAWVKSHPLTEQYEWPTKVLRAGPRKGQEVLQPWAYDMSDAFVIALAGPLVPA